MISPVSLQQKRLSIVINPYDPPSPISPLFALSPSPYSPCPYSPEASPPPSPSPVRQSQQPFASNSDDSRLSDPHASPVSHRPMRIRPKSYGGALTPATLELILGFEAKIAELESRHTKISVELEETRDSLANERAARRSSHRFSSISHARFSSISSSTHGSDGHASEQNDADYDRRLREELQDSLKKIRAQNALLSRSLRQKEDACASLTAALEEERSSRKAADEEAAKLSAVNFTLLEHNKLLASRDSALQEDIASLITKSQADEWMRGVLEDELRQRGPAQNDPEANISHTSRDTTAARRQSLGITLEHQGDLRAELVANRDELHIARVRLATAEDQCTTLTQRLTSFKEQLVMCLDSSSQVLEVERELRADVEERARLLADDNALLRARIASLEEGDSPDNKRATESEAKRVRPVSGRLQSKIEGSSVKINIGNRVRIRHHHILTSKKLREHRNRRLSKAKARKQHDPLLTPTKSNFEPKPFVISTNPPRTPTPPAIQTVPPFTPTSPESTCSTMVASPSPTSKRNKRMSVILAATLSKESRPAWSALKTNSSLYVDVSSRIDEPMTQLDSVASTPARPKRPRDLRTYMMRRASTLFVDFAHSYTAVDTVHESTFEHFV